MSTTPSQQPTTPGTSPSSAGISILCDLLLTYIVRIHKTKHTCNVKH